MSTVKDHRVPCGHVGLVLTYAGRPKLILRDHVPLNLQAYWAMKKNNSCENFQQTFNGLTKFYFQYSHKYMRILQGAV